MLGPFIESLLEAIDKVLSDGHISWGAIITALLFFNKIQRNKEFRLRDQRVERNQQRIMAKLEVEGEWATPQRTLLQMVRQSLRRLFFLSRKAIPQENPRRKRIMEKLKSRKLWMAIFAALLPVLNDQLGWGMNVETVIASVTGLVAYIIGQSHVDAKKIENGGTPDAKITVDTGANK